MCVYSDLGTPVRSLSEVSLPEQDEDEPVLLPPPDYSDDNSMMSSSPSPQNMVSNRRTTETVTNKADLFSLLSRIKCLGVCPLTYSQCLSNHLYRFQYVVFSVEMNLFALMKSFQVTLYDNKCRQIM